MISRLLRLVLQFFSHISKLSGSRSSSLLTWFVQRWSIVFKLLWSRYRRCFAAEGQSGRSIPTKERKYNRDPKSVQAEAGSGQTHSTGVLSFSLLPHSAGDHASMPSRPDTPNSSLADAQSSQSDRIAITLQTPQSPSSPSNGRAFEFADTRGSQTYLNYGLNEFPSENHLDAPARSSRGPTSPNTRPRSRSPGDRSSISGHPISSFTPYHPFVSSKSGLSRPQTPAGHSRSLRPIGSYTSLRPSLRPPSIITPEPEPLPIIEPADLPEHFLDPEGRIWTVAPQGISRYKKQIFTSKNAQDVVLKPMTMQFEAPWNPEGWEPIIHPEGQLYFCHTEKRVFTEAYLYDKIVFDHLERHLAKLDEFIDRLGLRSTLARHDLVLDFEPHEESGYYCGYYFANHQGRSIFWLQEYSASNLYDWNPEAGHKSKLHLKHAIEAEYWYHCQMFPTAIKLQIEHVSELRDILLHYIADSMLSPRYSIAPYTHEDLNRMLGWVNSLKKNLDTASSGSMCMLARLMTVFVHERFIHFYGEPAVRLLRGVSVYGTARNRTLLIRLLSPILFAAPLQHLIALERIYVDEIVHEPTWKVLINKFNKQWEEFILFATVMLNANMALLAIQSIDTNTPPYRRPAQVAAYLSVVASIASILLGLLLIKMNRIRLTETAPDALRFLDERVSKVVGLEMLAILYSLPFAFLMWGMIGFLCAFLFICFQDTTAVTRGIVGSASVLTGLAVVWCIWIGWDKSIHQQPEVPVQTKVVSDVVEGTHEPSAEAQVSGLDHSQGDRASMHHQANTNPDRSITAPYRQIWNRLSDSWKKLWLGHLSLNPYRPPTTSQDLGMTAPTV